MTLHLRPEIEELIRQDVDRGSTRARMNSSNAVELLHEQEAWLSSQRDEIARKIEDGWSSAERGELIPDREIRARMKARKQTWANQNHQ